MAHALHYHHDKVDDSTVSGPNAYVSVESLNEVPGKLRGVTHVFARQVSFTNTVAAAVQCQQKAPLFPWDGAKHRGRSKNPEFR